MKTDYEKMSLQWMMDEVSRIKAENPQRTADLCQEIIKESGEEFMYGKAFGEYYYAEALYRMNQTSELMNYAIPGLSIQKALGFYELEARTYNLLGAYCTEIGDYHSGYRCYYVGMELAKQHQMHHMLKVFYNNFGDLYLRLEDYERAIYYFNKTNDLLGEHTEMRDIVMERELTCVRYTNLIDAYLRIGKLKEALDAANQLMTIISESYLRTSSAMFYSILTRLNYAKGKVEQAHSSARLFLNCIREKLEPRFVGAVYLPMACFFLEKGLRKETGEIIDILLRSKEQIPDLAQWVELCRIHVEYHRMNQDAEKMLQAYEMYYHASVEQKKSNVKEKQKSIKVLSELQNAIRHQETILKKNRELERMSEHDALTGLANRYSINKYCEQMFDEACQKQLKFGVIIVDIDYFKEFNDTYGHIEGDRCICAIAHEIEKNSNGFLTARFGGDEFLIMTVNQDDETLENTAKELRQKVQALRIEHSGSKSVPYVTVSQGIYNCVPGKNDTVVDCIRMADMALYKVKKSSRNTYGFYTN